MFANRFRYVFIVMLAVYSFLNSLFLNLYDNYHIKAGNLTILSIFICVTLLVWEGNRYLEKVINKYAYNLPFSSYPLLFFFLVSLPVAFLASVLPLLVLSKYGLGMDTADFNLTTFKLVTAFGFRINLFMHCINSIIYFFSQMREKQLEAKELKRLQAQDQLQLLKNQINPHFLFNNLNILSSLIISKSSEANRFIEDFAVVFRYVLKNQEKDVVIFSTEYEFIKSYIFLLEMRFPNALKLEITLSNESMLLYTIPVALQMIMENAVKHNIASEKKPLTIKISDRDGYLYVKNNKQSKINPEESNKIGLSNIKERLRLINGKQIIINEDDAYFEVGLPLFKIDDYESIDPGR
jgi:two-component system LytT family sensor kinase